MDLSRLPGEATQEWLQRLIDTNADKYRIDLVARILFHEEEGDLIYHNFKDMSWLTNLFVLLLN